MTMFKFAFLLSLIVCHPISAYGIHIVSKTANIDITTEKVVHLTGFINKMSAQTWADETLATAGIEGPRIVLIDSPGGYATQGDEIIKMLETERRAGVQYVCVVLGRASSMAFNILTHCDVRLAAPNAEMLVHKIALESLPWGMRITARNLKYLAKEMERDDEVYRRANAKALGLSLSAYDHMADAETVQSIDKLLSTGYLHGLVKVTKWSR